MNLFCFFVIVMSLPRANGLKQHDGTRCDSDTWGVAVGGSSKLTRGPRPFLDIDPKSLVCHDKLHEQIKDLNKFTLNYYRDVPSFQSFNGVDLNPTRHWEYEHWSGERWGRISNLTASNQPPFWDGSADLSTCEIRKPDGWIYRIQDVGPITSTGGYDFWQFGWEDVFHLEEVLKENPNGIIFDSAFSAPVLPDGTPLGLPPIHIHHIHIGSLGVKAKDNTQPRLAIEQHGDYECSPEDGGIRCFFEKSPPGYGKLVRSPFNLEGEMNDVRAPNSPPMTWYYRIMLRYRFYSPGSSLTPISQQFIIGPGPGEHKQLNTLQVFPVLSGEESLYWYTARMPTSGQMIRNKLHSHNLAYNRSFFFHATPEQLGLVADNFKMGTPAVGCIGIDPEREGCIPKPLRETGFKDFETLEDFLFQRLADAQKNYTYPDLVCESHGARAAITDPVSGKSFSYDRRAPVCCKPWQFKAFDEVTIVAFIDKLTQPLGPHDPITIPKSTEMHIHWVMSYDEHRNDSIYYPPGIEFLLDEKTRQHFMESVERDRAMSWLGAAFQQFVRQKAESVSFLQTSSTGMTRPAATDKKAEYAQIFGMMIIFILGGYVAHKCSLESTAVTKPAMVCAMCCPPGAVHMKTRYVQYHTF